MRFDILTLFPDMLAGPLGHSILGRAIAEERVSVGLHDLRQWGLGRYRQVDDAPYGGGSGMVLRVDVVGAAIRALRTEGSRVLLMDPTGAPFRQATAQRLSAEEHVVLVCGHYEGVDARVREHLVDEVVSVGDYVLTGGELPALLIVDAVSRLVPGVLGNPESAVIESFSDGKLEAPCYTRPPEWEGLSVPDVLRSGHHGRIAAWRSEQSDALTRSRRPDLLAAAEAPPSPDGIDTGSSDQ